MQPPAPKLQPAVYGGLFIGVLSALPLVGALNACCCLWVLAGGLLATYLVQQNHPYPITAADGALVGLLAGVIGGVVGTMLSIPLQMLFGPMQQRLVERLMESSGEMPPELRQMIENIGRSGISGIRVAVQLVFSVCVYAIFGMLGGLLGVALFKKKDLPPPPGTIDVLPPA